ncbi:hypothetical protein [Candidatus Sororendozoicomonas aggregata]|uniref:hypothetical protein n=1 Tax=Candidatus Sororendozoicomonas aggregata TaxID=3073239 RepID=UPI002ED386DB
MKKNSFFIDALLISLLFSSAVFASPQLMRELYVAKEHIQNHMDIHYPKKFKFTIDDASPLEVTAEFTAPFGWWEGAYYKVVFDFSTITKHNDGPTVDVVKSPPIAHRYNRSLCLAQIIPNSDFENFWDSNKSLKKYASYNFDRVQQIMTVVNFMLLDYDIFDEGFGEKYVVYSSEEGDDREYIEKSNVIKLLEYTENIASLNQMLSSEITLNAQPETGEKSLPDSKCGLLENMPETVSYPLKKPLKYCQSYYRCECIACNPKKLDDLKKATLYSVHDLSARMNLSPIVVDFKDDWAEYSKEKNKYNYFVPVRMQALGRVEDFDANSHSTLEDFKTHLNQTIPGTFISKVLYKNKDITDDKEFREARQGLRDTSAKNVNLERQSGKKVTPKKKKNKPPKVKNKHHAILLSRKEAIDESFEKVNFSTVVLKSSKKMAKTSNNAIAHELIISEETPNKSARFRDGRQFGIEANTWIPTLVPDMTEYEKIAMIKLMANLGSGKFKLPIKREALTACAANNIIIKSLTMKMAKALDKKEVDWHPSQCFLDLIINAANMHYAIGSRSADIHYKSLALLLACYEGQLNRKKLKDFAFLPNYILSGFALLRKLYPDNYDYMVTVMKPRILINAFIEYLVRVLEKLPEGNTALSTDDEEEATMLTTLIESSQIGFNVVAHQLTILNFMISRAECLAPLDEFERNQLQGAIKDMQQGCTGEYRSGSYSYSSLMRRLFPDSDSWCLGPDFFSFRHRERLMEVVSIKANDRMKPSAKAVQGGALSNSNTAKSRENIPSNRGAMGATFLVDNFGEYHDVLKKLDKLVKTLKPCKNEPLQNDPEYHFRHVCSLCGKGYKTRNSLHTPVEAWKQKKAKRGFIYKGGKPECPDCRTPENKQIRKETMEKALRLIEEIEAGYPEIDGKTKNCTVCGELFEGKRSMLSTKQHDYVYRGGQLMHKTCRANYYRLIKNKQTTESESTNNAASNAISTQ